ncbi:MAG: PE-PPE domain-containing protein [Mycobacterium sp.]
MAAVLLALGQTLTPVVALTAATYILKGTNSAFNQIPDSAYPRFAQKYDSAVGAPTPQPIILVPYPATFRPVTPPGYIFSPTFDQSVATGVANLENPTTGRPLDSTTPGDVLWGYSQGATVVTQYKRDWNNAHPANPGAVPPTFVLVANPNRPNGGILERGVALGTIPILGLTFSGATPTYTAGQPANTVTTYDIARQYDGIADAPVNPLNPVADLNAMMGFYYLHGKYPSADPTTAIYQGQHGDTNYYLIPTYPLPLLMPLESIPVIGFPLADTLDPPLRVIVESAYDRSTSPGVPTPFNPLYSPNPLTFGPNLLAAIPTGLDNGISDFAGSRPFGTTRPGPYGVGGLATVGIDGQPTPPPSTPTQGTTPTIPVLFSSPGGLFAVLVPANLLGSVMAPNGGLPSITSSLNPMTGPSNLGTLAGQSPTGATQVSPAVVSSTSDTPASPPATTSASDSAQQLAPSAPTAAPQPSNEVQSSNTNVGPRLNVSRPSLGAPGSQQGTSSTTGPKSTTNPIGSTIAGVTNSISGVTNSISSALGGLSKAASGGTK